MRLGPVLGAAVDRPGVTVANLCDPWCCELTQTEFGAVGYVHNVSTERWATCDDAKEASSQAGEPRGAIEGAVVRCEKRKNVSPPTYEVAVYFTGLERDARQKLRDYVTRCAVK